MRTFDELSQLQTFEERFKYLQLNGSVGMDTFGFDRYLNQLFYNSKEWKSIRDFVIVRDNGCDLAVPGHEIFGKVYIHHMNPIDQRDIVDRSDFLLDPNFLICVSHKTHNAIHYGDEKQLDTKPAERFAGDTKLW